MTEPLTLNDIYEALIAPFEPAAVELKPGATTKTKDKALALCYVDARIYQQRLDDTVGPANWHVEYRPLPAGVGILCRLTVLGVTREDVGEAPEGDPNRHTSAAMQSFKRACAAFGLGRYLYSLPQIWVAYNDQYKRIEDPQSAVVEIYRKAGLLQQRQQARRAA